MGSPDNLFFCIDESVARQEGVVKISRCCWRRGKEFQLEAGKKGLVAAVELRVALELIEHAGNL